MARKHPRFGYRRAHALRCREAPGVNGKRVQRIWRSERLSLPCRRPRKKRAVRNERVPRQATRPHQVWSYDFIHDTCANGQRWKILTLSDECTRESVAIAGATRLRAREVLHVLQRIIAERGAPAPLRSDHGPAVVVQAVQQWLQAQHVPPASIAPGGPWQNGYGASFNGRLRDECLNLEWFRNVAEARVVIQTWQRYYNRGRPHSSLGYQTLHAFRLAHECQARSQPDLPPTIWPSPANAILTG